MKKGTWTVRHVTGILCLLFSLATSALAQAPSSASFLTSDTATQGNWQSKYGSDAHFIASGPQSSGLSYGSIAVHSASLWTWASGTTDTRALVVPGGSGGIASCWYNNSSFSVDVNITDGNFHQMALYALDWDYRGRAETIQIVDANNPNTVLSTQSISSFNGGTYLVWTISGHITINVAQTGGPNAVISGVFFDPANPSAGGPGATFVGVDTTTQGNWPGKYGADGYSIANCVQSLPSYATFTPQNVLLWTWMASTSDVRALRIPTSSLGIASTWYNNSSFSYDVNITDGNTHQIALYAVDWDSSVRSETVQIVDANNPSNVLDTESVANYQNGVYLVWNISRSVTINVIWTAGANAVVSGVFFDPANSTAPLITSNNRATFAVGTPSMFTVMASGAPTPTLSEVGALPSGVTFNATTGLLSGTPGVGTNTSYPLVFTASNNVGTNTQNFTLTVNTASASGPGVTFVGVDTTTQGNWPGKYGADGYSIANCVQSLPSYATFTPQNVLLWTWMASTSDVRALRIPTSSLGIASTWYNNSSFSYDVNITDGNTHQIALYAVDWDSSVRSETVQIVDANNPSNVLDTESVANYQNGVYLVWNISRSVTINVIWTAGANAVVSGVFFGPPVSVTTTAPATLAIITASLASGQVGTAYSQTLAASGGTTPYTWSLTSGTLPAGLTLNASTGAISGTPTGAANATALTFKVTDSGSPAQTTNVSLAQTIAPATLVITPASLASGQVGTAYSQTLAASGGTTPYTWSLTSGTLPAGLTLNASTGAISGTPTASGTFSFTVQVRDSSSPAQTATQGFTLSVPSASSSVLQITTVSLPSGITGVAYSTLLGATGGATPYTWSITSGSLPTGLSLAASTGIISGTPSASSFFPFTVQVKDANSQTASTSLGITVSSSSGTPITTCQTLASAGTYILQNDVSATGTCFVINADNVTLNLNGYTITYATATQTCAVFGISGIAPWDGDVAPGGIACGAPTSSDSFNSLTVNGPGGIVQGSGAAPYSHGIRLGQGGGDDLTVNNVTFTFSATSSVGVYENFNGNNSVVENSTFNNNVSSINSRSQIEGASIKFDDSQYLSGITVTGNTIIGGPQGGIQVESTGASVYNNTIEQGNPNGTTACGATLGCQYANDFSVYAWGANQNIYNNTIQPSEGRGILISGAVTPTTNTAVYGNTITVIEHANDSEYGGCEPTGTYGIQFDDAANQAVAYSNTVVAEASDCSGIGLRLTDTGSTGPGGNTSYNNSFTGKAVAGFTSPSFEYVAAGLGMDAVDGGFTSTNDTFIGDTASIYVDWDGIVKPVTLVSPTLGEGSNPNGYETFVFDNGTSVCAGCLHVRDPKFTGGASATSADMYTPMISGATAEYWIDWTYTLTVVNGTGNPLSGASVTITDALGNTAYAGTTNASGQISAVLTQFRMYNTSSTVVQENRTPDTVQITATGCTNSSTPVSLTQTTSQTIQLSCP